MDRVGVMGGTARSVVPLFSRPRIWFPFFVLCAAQLVAIGLVVSFHNPLILPLVVPLLKSAGGMGLTHYPILFLGLPTVLLRVNIVLGIFLETLVVAAATCLFAAAFAGNHPRGAWGRAARRYPILLAAGAIVMGLLLAVSLLRELIPSETFVTNAFVRWGTRGGLIVLTAIVQTFLVFITPLVILKGKGLFSALAGSISVGLRTFGPTFTIILAAALVIYPLDFLSARPDLLVNKLKPETVSWLLGLRSLIQVPVGFFVTGAITWIFVRERGGLE